MHAGVTTACTLSADAELLETPKDLIKRCAVEVLEAYDPTQRGRSSQADLRLVVFFCGPEQYGRLTPILNPCFQLLWNSADPAAALCVNIAIYLCRFEHGKMMIKQWQASNTILIAFAGTKDITDTAVDLLAYASPPVGSKNIGGKGHVIHTGAPQPYYKHDFQ